MIRICAFLYTIVSLTNAFSVVNSPTATTRLIMLHASQHRDDHDVDIQDMSSIRRQVLRSLLWTPGQMVLAAALTTPIVAQAKTASTFFFDEKIEQVVEPAQMATGGKLDLNAAFVNEYMQFPGMFPHAAGKIASHGPYKSVKDIYKIEDLSDNDVRMFQKYESYFTVNPPGRAFGERINARVST